MGWNQAVMAGTHRAKDAEIAALKAALRDAERECALLEVRAEQAEREQDEARVKEAFRLGERDAALARLESVPALVEALRKIADEGECSMNLSDQCVGAVHSRRKRWDNPERVERVGCAKHYAEAALAVYEQSQGNG